MSNSFFPQLPKTCEIATILRILAQTTVPYSLALFSGHGAGNQIIFLAEPPPSVGALENLFGFILRVVLLNMFDTNFICIDFGRCVA